MAHKATETSARFVLNGRPVVAEAPATTTLLEFVRARGLTGTKEGCAEGDCGACTVALRTAEGPGLRTRAVNACIMPLAMVHGAAVVTVEGIGDEELHPIQREMAERHASQCGFCTPGIVMSLWCREAGAPADSAAICDRLAGNLCRCTGYGPILKAAAEAAERADADAVGRATTDADLAARLGRIGPLDLKSDGRRFIAPTDEPSFAQAVAQQPEATILSGATDVGIWITKAMFDPPVVIHTARVPELRMVRGEDDALVIGAAVTHAEFAAAVGKHSGELAELLRRFGGLQVRNAGTVGGNIANGSPIGDLPPALIAAGAVLELARLEERRTMPLEDYFLAYGKQDRRPGEYVRAVRVPLAGLTALTCHKVTKRFDSDITAVLGAFALTLDEGRVSAARLAFGGMAATPKRAREAEAALIGSTYDEASVAAAADALPRDFSPISDLRASADYRMRVAQNLLRRDHMGRTGGAAVRLAGPHVADLAA